MTEQDRSNRERAIQTALSALGNAAPPDGMEVRLQRALREAPARSGLRRKPLLGRLCVSAAAACVLAGTTAVVVWLAHTGERPAVATLGRIAGPPMQPHAAVAAAAPAVQALHTRHTGVAPATQPRLSAPLRASAEMRPQGSDRDIDQPPPPLPLTEQERLLLKIAHRGDPVTMAALDDAHTRSRDVEADKSQFDDFFYMHATETHDEDQ